MGLAAASAHALNPESPAVKRLIDSGLKYLEDSDQGGLRFEGRLGGQSLMGLCCFKARGKADHPHVVEAIRRCQEACRIPAEQMQVDLYSTGIAIVFLCEVDAEKYASEIETFSTSLVKRQKAQGAWGYPSGDHAATCDTSMTQYGVLGLWTARGHGIAVPEETIVAAANWLVRTQDPSGGWGYQGIDPGDFRRVRQENVRPSLAAAGLGSSYMCADMLGLRVELPDRSIEGLPAAFQKVEEKAPEEQRPRDDKVEAKRIRQACLDGNRWLAQNLTFDGQNWTYYYMYGLERAMSFRELVEGRSTGASWYDRGVAHLTKSQHDDGHWESNSGALVDTAFALLFLMRGTKKTIEKTVGEQSLAGVLIGGRGLPTDTSNVRVVGGRVVGTSLATTVDELLSILEDPENEDFPSTVEFPPELRVDATDPKERAVQLERLAQLASKGSVEVRVVAVKTLSMSGRFDVVPALIAALEDRDNRVAIAARDGLRRVSRKFNAWGPPDNPTAAEKTIAANQWRTWYASVAP
jgi:hypothetical protein